MADGGIRQSRMIRGEMDEMELVNIICTLGTPREETGNRHYLYVTTLTPWRQFFYHLMSIDSAPVSRW